MPLAGNEKRLVEDVYDAWCQDCSQEKTTEMGLAPSSIRDWASSHVVRTGHTVRVLHQQVREFTWENSGHMILRGGHARTA